jgi:hypothetical protein
MTENPHLSARTDGEILMFSKINVKIIKNTIDFG